MSEVKEYELMCGAGDTRTPLVSDEEINAHYWREHSTGLGRFHHADGASFVRDRYESELTALRAERDRLWEEVNDWRASANKAAGEMCSDEIHCTCVGPLREEVRRLREASLAMMTMFEPFRYVAGHFTGGDAERAWRTLFDAVKPAPLPAPSDQAKEG